MSISELKNRLDKEQDKLIANDRLICWALTSPALHQRAANKVVQLASDAFLDDLQGLFNRRSELLSTIKNMSQRINELRQEARSEVIPGYTTERP